MKDYPIDIAISLCKEDVEFARKFVKALNPKLEVFFYEDRQEDLIAKSGPEEFAKVFKEKARVVVILSRKEWSESFYTALERNAIIDRIKDGYAFLFVIPVVDNQVPAWYPSTQIYASPERFSILQLAQFCEFKVTELGGEVTPLTFDEKVQYFHEQYEERMEYVQYLYSEDAYAACCDEIEVLLKYFDGKLDYASNLKQQRLQDGGKPVFSEWVHFFKCEGSIGIEDYFLMIRLHDRHKLNQCQGYRPSSQFIELELSILQDPNRKRRNGSVHMQEKFKFNQNGEHLRGWSRRIPLKLENWKNHKQLYLNDLTGNEYDLGPIYTSKNLIDSWLIKIMDLVEGKIFNPPQEKGTWLD